MACPLCTHPVSKDSWMGTTVYDEQTFTYLECLACRTLYCEPMPDDETVGKMYGIEYQTNYDEEFSAIDSKQSQRAIRQLKKLGRPGVFADYGCGKGALLISAQKIGWESFGIEYSDEVAASAEKATGIKVFTADNDLPVGRQADVLHLGDVIEHLTDLNKQIPQILRWLKPGGWLIAQGPLEAHRNLFTSVLKNARAIRKNEPATMPPYHVILATSAGQRPFFERFGFTELEYHVYEANHPAPSNLEASVLTNPRLLAMFALRTASRITSAILPGEWGNRYFYCGQLADMGRNPTVMADLG